MKQSIIWHEVCIKNLEEYLAREKEHIDRNLARYEENIKDLKFYRRQIEAAKAKKRDSFDREKFLKKGRNNNEKM